MNDIKDVTPKIHKDMLISEIVSKYPESTEVFYGYGLSCAGCWNSMLETLEEGADLHYLDLDELLDDLLYMVEETEKEKAKAKEAEK